MADSYDGLRGYEAFATIPHDALGALVRIATVAPDAPGALSDYEKIGPLKRAGLVTEPQLSALTVRVEATHLGRIAAALVSGYHQRPGKDAAGAPARSDAPKTNVAHLVGVALAPAAVAPAGASLGGLRHDSGKVRLDLIPPEWIEALGQVLTKGAEKYAARNWEKGMAWSKMIGCAMRHLLAFLRGERFDQETGCHHLAHAAWNVLALMSYDVRGIGDHDLPRAKTSPTMLVGDGEARP